MTKATEIIGQTGRTTAARGRHAGEAYGTFGSVLQSAIGVARESVGLVHNAAGLGIALVPDTRTAEQKRLPAPKPLPAPDATNVIRFPVPRNIRPRHQQE